MTDEEQVFAAVRNDDGFVELVVVPATVPTPQATDEENAGLSPLTDDGLG